MKLINIKAKQCKCLFQLSYCCKQFKYSSNARFNTFKTKMYTNPKEEQHLKSKPQDI